MPGALRSSVYLPAPVVLPAASIMAIGLPMMEKSSLVFGRSSWVKNSFLAGFGLTRELKRRLCLRNADPSTAHHRSASGDAPVGMIVSYGSLRGGRSFLLCFDRGLDGLIHLAVAGAAAEIAAQSAANFIVGGIWIMSEEVANRHHETRRAVATLRSAPVAVSFLDGGEAAMLADAFDRGDLLAFATGGEYGAGEHGDAVDLNRAGAAG